jgi:hypothetical protein
MKKGFHCRVSSTIEFSSTTREIESANFFSSAYELSSTHDKFVDSEADLKVDCAIQQKSKQ